MGYGNPAWGSWVKSEEEAIPFIKKAFELGINFFDTADGYSNGESEVVLGKAIKAIGAPRSRFVIATKAYAPVFDDPGRLDRTGIENEPEYVNRYGLSRKYLFEAVNASLKRLDLDYIDLFFIHRYDENTPIEETMEALHDLVKAGKIRYIAASSMKTWQFQKMNHVAESRGWTKFVAMQNLYNLLYREEEREMAPYCADSGIGWTPWSPLAMGLLAGRKVGTTTRSKGIFTVETMYPQVTSEKASNDMIIERLAQLAEKYGATSAQVAIAWQFTKEYVTAPIVGATKIEQLYDLVGSLNVELTPEDVKFLEQPYAPRFEIQ